MLWLASVKATLRSRKVRITNSLTVFKDLRLAINARSISSNESSYDVFVNGTGIKMES